MMEHIKKTTDRKFVQNYRHTIKVVKFYFKYCGGTFVYKANAFVVLVCLVKFLALHN